MFYLFRTYRGVIFISWFFTGFLGLASKFVINFSLAPWAKWVNDSAGDILYQIFWLLILIFIWPNFAPRQIAVAVFCISSVLEFLQLWHPPVLEAIRSTFAGRLLIGTTFSWSDFFYYFLGSLLGYLWLQYLKRKFY